MTEPNGSPSDSDSFVIVDFMEKDDQTAKSDTIQVEPNEKTSQEAANFSITTDYFGMKKDDDTSNRSDLDNQDSLDVDITSTSDPSPTNPFDTDPSLGGIAESNRQELSPNNSNHSLLDGFESDANSPFAKPVKRVQQPARKRTAPTQSKKKDNPLDGFAKTPDPTISQDDDLENAVFNNLPGMNQGSPVTSPTRQESFPSPLTSPSASNTQTNLFSSNSLRDVDCHIIVSKPTLVRDPTPDNIFATPTPTASANAVDNPFEGFEASTNSLVSETFQQIPSADSEPLEGFEDTFIGLATTPDNSLTKKFEVEVPANDLSPDNQKVEQLANLNPVVTENLDDSGPEVLTVASDSDNPFEASSEIVGNTCENPPISTQTSTTRTSDNPFTGFGDSSAAMTHNTTASENPFGDISAGTSSDQPPDNGASDNPFANIADLSKPEQSETPKSPISDSADASNALDNTTASDNPFGDVLDGISSDQSPDNGASDNPFTNIADLSKPEQSETPKSPISDSADASNALNVNPFSSEKRPEITEQSERTDAENPFVVSAEDSADASNAVEVNPFAFENTPAAKIEQSESTVEESNSFAASKNSDFLDMFGSLTHQPANDMHAETKAENPEKAETRKEPPLDPFADLLAPTQNAPVQDDIFGDLMAKSAEPPVKNLEPDKNQSDLGFEDLVGGAESSLKKDEVGVDIIPSEKFSDPIEKSQDDNVGFGDFAEAEPQKKEHSQNDAFGSGDSTAQPDNNVPADGFALESAKSEEPSQTDDFGFGDLASELKPVQKAEVPENDDFATKPVEKASSNDDFGFGDFSPVQEQAENMDAIETAEPINNDVAEQPDDFGFGDADDQFGVKKTSAADDFGGFGDFAETSEKPAEQEHAKDDCAFGDEDLKKEDNAAKVGPEEVQQTCGADEFGFGDFPEQSEKPAKADSFEDDFGFGDQEQLEIQTADVEQTSVRDEFGSGGFPEQSERPAQANDAFGFENKEQTKPPKQSPFRPPFTETTKEPPFSNETTPKPTNSNPPKAFPNERSFPQPPKGNFSQPKPQHCDQHFLPQPFAPPYGAHESPFPQQHMQSSYPQHPPPFAQQQHGVPHNQPFPHGPPANAPQMRGIGYPPPNSLHQQKNPKNQPFFQQQGPPFQQQPSPYFHQQQPFQQQQPGSTLQRPGPSFNQQQHFQQQQQQPAQGVDEEIDSRFLSPPPTIIQFPEDYKCPNCMNMSPEILMACHACNRRCAFECWISDTATCNQAVIFCKATSGRSKFVCGKCSPSLSIDLLTGRVLDASPMNVLGDSPDRNAHVDIQTKRFRSRTIDPYSFKKKKKKQMRDIDVKKVDLYEWFTTTQIIRGDQLPDSLLNSAPNDQFFDMFNESWMSGAFGCGDLAIFALVQMAAQHSNEWYVAFQDYLNRKEPLDLLNANFALSQRLTVRRWIDAKMTSLSTDVSSWQKRMDVSGAVILSHMKYNMHLVMGTKASVCELKTQTLIPLKRFQNPVVQDGDFLCVTFIDGQPFGSVVHRDYPSGSYSLIEYCGVNLRLSKEYEALENLLIPSTASLAATASLEYLGRREFKEILQAHPNDRSFHVWTCNGYVPTLEYDGVDTDTNSKTIPCVRVPQLAIYDLQNRTTAVVNGMSQCAFESCNLLGTELCQNCRVCSWCPAHIKQGSANHRRRCRRRRIDDTNLKIHLLEQAVMK